MAEEPKADDSIDQVDLDLDTLVRPKKKIRMPGGTVIEIEPPDLETLFKLAKMGGDLQKAKTELEQTKEDLDADKADELYKKMKAAFIEVIPQLKDYKLDFDQIFKLLDFIVNLSMPADVSELEKRGIKLDSNQKKILQSYSKTSRTSSDSTPDTP